MQGKHRRIIREEKTLKAMVSIYCRDHHKPSAHLCEECSELLHYSCRQLEKCPFQETKTTCGNCRIHCYNPRMREKIRNIMGYSGPRMAYRHPLLALLHFFDGFRKKPESRGRKKSQTEVN
jgi:hypothetical protein